ncbi:MAG: hypothetical protein ACRCXZ_03475, partial [Patescibacteria group bacterium]
KDCYDLWSFMSDGKVANNQGDKIKNLKFFLALMSQNDISFSEIDTKPIGKDRKSSSISQLQRAIHKFITDNKFKFSVGPDDFVSRSTLEDLEIENTFNSEDDEDEDETAPAQLALSKSEAYDLIKESYTKMLFVAVKHFCGSDCELSYEDFCSMGVEMVSSYISNNVDKNKLNSEYDFSKSVMFICGNFYTFDYELYGNSSLYDADQLREITTRFTVRQLKDSLKSKLSREQFNRLGSNFLLLPSFGKSSFETLISQRLDVFKEIVASKHGFCITFHPSIAIYLYNRGVSPLEGFRPLKSEIDTFVSIAFGLITKAVSEGNTSGTLWFNNDSRVVELQATNNFYQSLKDQSYNEDEIDQEVMLLNSIEIAARVLIYAIEFRTIPKQIVVGVNKNQQNIFQIHESVDSYKIRIAKIKFLLAPSILSNQLFGEDAPLIYSEDLGIAARMIQDLVVNHQLVIEDTETYIREFNRISKEVRKKLTELFSQHSKISLELIDLINQSKGPVDNNQILEFLKKKGLFVFTEQEFTSMTQNEKTFSSVTGKTTYSLAISLLKGK